MASAAEFKALLLHLGHNMWCDWFPEDMDLAALAASYAGKAGFDLPDAELRSKVCRRDIPANHLKGFLMAPWASCDTQEQADFNIRGIDLFAEALKQ